MGGMGTSAIHVLLLQRADDTAHADRAWWQMADWVPAFTPSGLSEQVDKALELTREKTTSPRQPIG